MIKNISIIILLLAVSVLTAADAGIDNLIEQGIDFAQRQEYNRADSCFDLIPRNHPGAYLFKSIALQALMGEEHDYRAGEPTLSYCRRTIELADAMIKKNPSSAEGYFYRGMGYGTLGTYQARVREWFSSFRSGSKGIDDLKKCVALDSLYYDAYTGLGVYHYWKSKITRYLSWLPFVSDDRPRGKHELSVATERARFLNHPARYSMIWVYYEEKNYAAALQLCEGFLKQYPENTTFLRSKADVMFRMDDQAGTIAAYRLLLDVLADRPTANKIEEIECHYKLALSLERTGAAGDALAEYQTVLATAVPEWAQSEAGPYRSKAEERISSISKGKQ